MTVPEPLARALWRMALLSLGGAVALGFARFAYALILPAMRADLHWSFTLAGAMNAANAVGYLLGALTATRAAARWGLRGVFAGGMALTALSLLACALTGVAPALLALRFLAGVGGALVFVTGGALAALAARAHPERSALLLGVFYGGAGLGILASALLLPPLLASGWRGAWAVLGAVSLLALAATLPALARLPDLVAGGAGTRRASLVPLAWALAAYAAFGVGYIAYMTFIIAFLRAGGAGDLVTMFWAVLGAAVMLSALAWQRPATRLPGARAMGAQMLTLALGAALPLLSTSPAALLASGLLFGGSFLAVVTFTTILTRRTLPEAAWGQGIAAFTVIFAAGQTLGPLLTGALSDAAGGLRAGLGVSALVLLFGAGLAWGQPTAADR
ncbi:YbfB/YjiJ family MFS transporter [Deinococcus metallilatus]|uniref:MFS family arabinose efflux permease n=2 Tax=Deinococcus metallilatus TaxID=1211322 RepID=A0ABR6MY68_9DEIO|nr:YbfB/YjiJ family MFS transporter [Deinococcus metallilatus]MBB5296290.1 putative MFS family arabinose efflux permease [Deinococcus metallilatus]GMA14798.1 MFS transporter [Deinococcus metallilatus]